MNPQSSETRGFSLVELMCSMTVGLLILLAAVSLLGGTGDSYRRLGGSVSAEREARAALSQLASDCAAARFHEDMVVEKSTAPWPTDRLGFLCLQPAHAQSDAGRIGDLCAVYYHVGDLTIGGKTVRCLMRGFRESAESFKALEFGNVPALFAGRGQLDEPIAFGVVSFVARPKSRGPDGTWVDWGANNQSGPEAFDVRLVIARPDLAARLKEPGDWDGVGHGRGRLGVPSEMKRDENLDVYEIRIHFGSHATP